MNDDYIKRATMLIRSMDTHAVQLELLSNLPTDDLKNFRHALDIVRKTHQRYIDEARYAEGVVSTLLRQRGEYK